MTFRTWKDLIRHFSIRIVTYFFILVRSRANEAPDTDVSCQEYCSWCERIYTRAGPYLHHKCKRGNSRNNSTLRRRSVVRTKVKRELKIARKLRKLPDGSPLPHPKRRKTEGGDVTVGIQTDLNGQVVEPTVAETFPNSLRPELETDISLLPNIGEQAAPRDSAFEISNGAATSFTEPPLFDTQTTRRFPFSRVEYGSKAPALYSDSFFGSKAPAMYIGSEFGPQILASYSDAVSGSKAPAMYLGSVFGSQMSASYPDEVLGLKAPVMSSDAGFRSGLHFHENSSSPGASGYG